MYDIIYFIFFWFHPTFGELYGNVMASRVIMDLHYVKVEQCSKNIQNKTNHQFYKTFKTVLREFNTTIYEKTIFYSLFICL